MRRDFQRGCRPYLIHAIAAAVQECSGGVRQEVVLRKPAQDLRQQNSHFRQVSPAYLQFRQLTLYHFYFD